MMSRFQKILFFLPVLVAFDLCDKSLLDFIKTMIGGSIMWVPYWIAWRLSDGFSMKGAPCTKKDFDDSGYKYGPDGFGYYVGNHRIDH